MIVPALNEEEALRPTVEMLLSVVERLFDDFEILIINDGSVDSTPIIAAELAATRTGVRVVHHDANRGLGYCYREGMVLATKEFVGWIPGDGGGLTSVDDLTAILGAVGSADMVLVWIASDTRPFFRLFISKLYTRLLNAALGFRVHYYNGPNVYRRALAIDVLSDTSSYGAFAELQARMLRGGHTWIEVPMHNRERVAGRSRGLRLRNVAGVIKTILRLAWEFRITHRQGRSGHLRA